MNKILLTTRPDYDDGTAYLSYYTSLILRKAEELGIDNKDFHGNDLTVEKVIKYIIKKEPKLIFVNGHGNSESLEGNKEDILFSTDKNIELLKNKIVYARACHAGLSFGPKMVKDNKGCFIGYNTPFSFWIDGSRSSTPAKDKTAELFLLPSNEVMLSLIKGNDAETSNEKSKEMIIENMKKVLRMEEKKEPGAIGWLEILWNNFDGQVLYGKRDICF